jgi:hypothetical protein
MNGGKRMLVPEANYHIEVQQGLMAGAALTNAVPVTASVSLVEASDWAFYFKATCNGTLTFEYLRPNLTSVYDTNAIANVAVTANTEAFCHPDLDVSAAEIPHGQGAMRITFTPSADGAVVYADFCARRS